MLNFICGEVGSGKTQRLIDMANQELDNTKGLIVYIDKSTKHRLSIDNKIRFINAREFFVTTPQALRAFISGIIAGNYDINRVYIDNTNIIADASTGEDFLSIFDGLEALSKEHNIEFYITINSDDAKLFDVEKYK